MLVWWKKFLLLNSHYLVVFICPITLLLTIIYAKVVNKGDIFALKSSFNVEKELTILDKIKEAFVYLMQLINL